MLIAFSALAPADVEFVVGYGGPRNEFDRITWPNRIFLEHATFRGRIEEQNFSPWLNAVGRWIQDRQRAPDYVHFSENDHIPLRRDYWSELAGAMNRSGCDFLGKWCMDRTGTNEEFYLRYRRDPILRTVLEPLGQVEPRIWGALADGMVFKQQALQALSDVDLDIPCFTEILIPSVLAKLGFRLGDMDAWSDVFRWVRHRPAFEVADVDALLAGGAFCCHPFKDLGRLPELWTRLGRLTGC